MRILIYGAGVIGSIFACKLSQAGEDITVLARGARYDEIKTCGIVLEHPKTGINETAKVTTIETLHPDDIYDYILVTLQRTQVDTVLPFLAQNKTPFIVFMANTALGYSAYRHAVGAQRLLCGFPAAGGERVNGTVRYFIGHGLMRLFQTTTFGAYSQENSQHVLRLIDIVNRAGIPAVYSKDMDAWQKTHVALVTSIANALYGHESNNYKLATSYSDILRMIQGIKEGLPVLKALNIPVTPSKLKYFMLPAPLLAAVFKLFMNTQLAEITMAKHTSAARAEMPCLQHEFDELIMKSGVRTPNIDKLRCNLGN